jgi:hypothetical protein
MNETNLSHLTVTIKIFLAMKQAIELSRWCVMPRLTTVYNRKHQPFLYVRHSRFLGIGFIFFDKNGKNVTDKILAILKQEV